MNTEKYLYYCIYLLIATPLVTTVGKALLKTFSQIQTFAICMILACGVDNCFSQLCLTYLIK